VTPNDGSLENSYLWADGQILARYTHNTDETIKGEKTINEIASVAPLRLRQLHFCSPICKLGI